MSYRADVTIIGAGVIGLAIAAQVASGKRGVYILEKNEKFGQETSSRHSGVIHSGIYYSEGSLKAKMCIAGNRDLYQLCHRYGIGHKKLGKLIVAISDEEIGALETLLERGQRNGAEGLKLLSQREMKELEPNIAGVAALLSPSTGIIDSHGLMKFFIAKASGGGAQIAYQTKVVGIEKVSDGYEVIVEDGTERLSFITSVLINCAGLCCDKVAALAGIDIAKAGYQLHYCKGEYFSVGNGKNTLVKRLIFPLPQAGATGLGIHVSLDLEGGMHLGPSAHYIDNIDYTVTSEHKQLFYDSVKGFLPFIDYRDLEPEMAGIRPKLQAPGGDTRDFVIREESDKDLPGFINLIGIESPGLTACPAIAKYVARLVEELLSG